MRFRGKNVLFALFLFLPGMFSAFGTFLLRQFLGTKGWVTPGAEPRAGPNPRFQKGTT
ncbi:MULTISPECIES: hypothetical protein [unclassified Streptomyces]|uniref:Uncharacterized protein n=1 Tax=Streptomyces sp. NBC_00119 TaxID=2975659 RepID=A0AAU1U2Z8_9ACTN|nr:MULTISPECIES: hypothetical protein [unclassified Streptomyces]MCX4641193.1 hypothetical protein [Streptomyces sp. NBC_01446]MCX5322390.1 hypothetical protein [Streptomyces sp. NBC_00120]